MALAATACTTHCTACARCQYISVSLKFRDCTWWHGHCELSVEKGPFETFKTAIGCNSDRHIRPIELPPQIEEHHGTRADRSQPLEAASAEPLWLAIGFIVGPGVRTPSHGSIGTPGLRFLHQSYASHLNGTLAWQYVSTEARHKNDPRFTVVQCRDGPFHHLSKDDLTSAIASACACKTIMWFRKALHLFPHARFIGKAEDDSAIHDSRILTELRHGYLTHGPAHLLWYGMFQWAGLNPSSRRNGWYCAEGDNLLKHDTTRMGHCFQPKLKSGSLDIPLNSSSGSGSGKHGSSSAVSWSSDPSISSVIGPFASGGLDIRSRGLAELIATTGYDQRFAHEWTLEGLHNGCEDDRESCLDGEWAVACDALQGYLVARTLRHASNSGTGVPNVTALHLTTSKFHYPPTKTDTSILHGLELKEAVDWKVLPSWRYHSGQAMLPIPMRLFLTNHGIGWHAEDKQHVDAFLARRKGEGVGCDGDGGTGVGRLPCAPVASEEDLSHVVRR